MRINSCPIFHNLRSKILVSVYEYLGPSFEAYVRAATSVNTPLPKDGDRVRRSPIGTQTCTSIALSRKYFLLLVYLSLLTYTKIGRSSHANQWRIGLIFELCQR